MKSIILVDGDDWIGLYVDGVLTDEGHDVTIQELCWRVKDEPFTISYETCDPDWICEVGNFPHKIEDVVFDD